MKPAVPAAVLKAFISDKDGIPVEEIEHLRVEQIGNGLINHSYKITCTNHADFFLQQINTAVFEHPQWLQHNYMEIWQFAEFEFTGLKLPAPIFCGHQDTLYNDHEGGYWRAFEFIENSKTLSVAQKPAQARATARAFARFTLAFEEMNTRLLKEVIPGFHDLGLRYRQFEEALQTEHYERMAVSRELISELKKRERYRHFYEIITESGEFPKRVMHHDAKISNVLFHEKTGKVICPVDYDTVMPGYYFSDLGDMIRSMVSAEDENQLTEPVIRKEFYEAIVNGYTDVLGGILSSSERKYIHAAGLLMIYMQALRFLSDYLNGDIYYQVIRPEQNLERARNQYSLLRNLENFLQEEYQFVI